MACKKCGGGRTRVVAANQSQQMSQMTSDSMVEVEYTGPAKQKQRIRSRVIPSHSMIFDGDHSRRFFAYPADAEILAQNRNFSIVSAPQPSEIVQPAKVPALISHTKPLAQTGIETLGLDNITESVLRKAGYTTVESVKRAPEAALLSVKGMGQKRVTLVKEAASAL